MSSTVFYESASELATLSNLFTVGGVPTDPSTVTLTVTTPSGVSTDYTYSASVTRTGTGAYSKDVACSEDGTWTYLWTGTGTAADVQAGTWQVWPTDLGHLYVTVEALKSRLGIVDTSDDLELHGACFAASRAIELYTGRIFWRGPAGQARELATDNACLVRLPDYHDLISATEVAADAAGTGAWTVLASNAYKLWPLGNPYAPEVWPYTEIRATAAGGTPFRRYAAGSPNVRVTGTWGWPQIPQVIAENARNHAAELFRLRNAPVIGSAGFGELGVARVQVAADFDRRVDAYRRTFGYA